MIQKQLQLCTDNNHSQHPSIPCQQQSTSTRQEIQTEKPDKESRKSFESTLDDDLAQYSPIPCPRQSSSTIRDIQTEICGDETWIDSDITSNDSPRTETSSKRNQRAQELLTFGTRIIDEEHHNLYFIREIIGQGSYGVVYKATKTNQITGKEEIRALKEYNPFLFKIDIEYSLHKQMFRQEYETLAFLNHENIISVVDFFNANHTCYFDMEYIEGKNLYHYLANICTFSHWMMHGGNSRNLAMNEAIDIMYSIVKTVNYLHKQKILHLDLKTNNIIRRKDGHLFLIDFGQCVNLNKLDNWVVPIRFNTRYHQEKFLSSNNRFHTAAKFDATTFLGKQSIEFENKNGLLKEKFKESLDLYSIGKILYDIFSICGENKGNKVEISDIRELHVNNYIKIIICKSLNLHLIPYITSLEILKAIQNYRLKKVIYKHMILITEKIINIILHIILFPICFIFSLLFCRKHFLSNIIYFIQKKILTLYEDEYIHYEYVVPGTENWS